MPFLARGCRKMWWSFLFNRWYQSFIFWNFGNNKNYTWHLGRGVTTCKSQLIIWQYIL